ncbi:MAG: potassium channel family protein [Hyphomonadaceae bacterium]|nr:potassium channel family protein [Hyphomonadaceae bacterium]
MSASPVGDNLAQNLAVATAMVAITVLIHFWGLLTLAHLMNRGGARFRPHETRFGQAGLVLFVVFGVIGLHTVEVWLYAALYLLLGEARALEEAVYFSTVTFMSLGYGDIVLSPRWRLVSAIEAANGVILVAWSTAFFISVATRMRLMDQDWLDPPPPGAR